MDPTYASLRLRGRSHLHARRPHALQHSPHHRARNDQQPTHRKDLEAKGHCCTHACGHVESLEGTLVCPLEVCGRREHILREVSASVGVHEVSQSLGFVLLILVDIYVMILVSTIPSYPNVQERSWADSALGPRTSRVKPSQKVIRRYEKPHAYAPQPSNLQPNGPLAYSIDYRSALSIYSPRCILLVDLVGALIFGRP